MTSSDVCLLKYVWFNVLDLFLTFGVVILLNTLYTIHYRVVEPRESGQLKHFEKKNLKLISFRQVFILHSIAFYEVSVY